jgi:RimJ/RimL family protein N-acetyltransferase
MMASMTEPAALSITLVPMSQVEWEAWRARSIRDYADAKVSAGAWRPVEAFDLATRELEELLPDGPMTTGHELRSVVTHEGVVVGGVWLGAKGPHDPQGCFVWDIQIHPEMRRRGYGRDAMQALERFAYDLGYRRLELHIFGDNTVARALYLSLGFIETDVSMRKQLG